MIKKIILLFSLALFTFQFGYSTHIVGGDVTYTCEGFNSDSSEVRIMVEFTMYRDLFSGGAVFDDPGRFGIWNGSGNSWSYYGVRTQNFTNREEIEYIDDPCVDVPTNVGVEKATYRFPVDLELNGDDYIIGYQRCCRNPTIANLINPGDAGAAFQIQITAEALLECNDSPTFDGFPPIFICANFNLFFDHGASDAQGDDLVYSFCAPLQAGGTDGSNGPGSGDAEACTGVTPNPANCGPLFASVNFRPPFTALNPLGGDPTISIDPTTGIITGIPNMQGQYVVGVCVKEFRDGVFLGEIRRDFQFNVITCTPTVFADLATGDLLDEQFYNIISCGETIVDIKNRSYQESSIISYDWWFDINGDTTLFDTKDVSVEFPGTGNYQGQMILNEGTDCSDTADIVVNVYPAIEADFDSEYDTCIAGPIAFEDLSMTGADNIVAWEWAFDEQGDSEEQNPTFNFEEPGELKVSLIATDNNECRDTVEQDVTWYPVPPLLVIEPTKFLACEPGEITFNNLSTPINDEYDITWTFGDGGTSGEISPTYIYENPGVYSVNLEIVSPIGCKTEKFLQNWITVEESPTADFTFTPEDPNNFNNELEFTDQSINSETQQWQFGDEFTSLEQNPTYTFRDTGMYDIMLIAFHASGCPDTIIKSIDIEPIVDYFVPSAFTPNGDGQNDEFIGKGFLSGLKDFEMSIWNRWGEEVFQTEDPYNGWNGRKYNNGSLSPQGVYVWQLKYIGPRGDDAIQKGHVTLLR